jgi:hypothetical protein
LSGLVLLYILVLFMNSPPVSIIMYKGENYIYDYSIFCLIMSLSEIRLKIHKTAFHSTS